MDPFVKAKNSVLGVLRQGHLNIRNPFPKSCSKDRLEDLVSQTRIFAGGV